MNRPATRSLREEILSLPLPQKSWRDFYSLQLIRHNCSDRVSFLKLQCGEVPILKYASQQGKSVFAIQVDADAPDVVRSCAKVDWQNWRNRPYVPCTISHRSFGISSRILTMETLTKKTAQDKPGPWEQGQVMAFLQ